MDHVGITKYRWTANTPRAHITNQRTVEIMRDMGIEQDVLEQATPHELMGETVFCSSLAGDEIGRARTWGTHPRREADYRLTSPSMNCDLPQTLFEPILVGHAASRGSRFRFDTEYVSLTQDAEGVTVLVRDRLSDHEYRIRAGYAERYREGRVFAVGDAVHRHPPSNGLGSNTFIQDSYNLAWKLAHVLRGCAGEGPSP